MATPRTIRLPLGVSPRGGAPLTTSSEQGREATEQLLALELSPPGPTTHPWGQEIGLREDVVFAEPGKAEVDLRAQLVEKFEVLEGLERARLMPDSVTFGPDPDREGAYVLGFRWQDLRRRVVRHTTLRLSGGGA